MSGTWRRRLGARFFPAILLLFMVSFYMPISAKASNNIFYAGLAAPAVIWWLLKPRLILEPYRTAPTFFVLFALLALALTFADVAFLKDSIYVAALFLVCVMLERNEGSVRRAFLVFSIVGLALLGAAAIEWLMFMKGAGIALRLALWGRTENPIFAALMIISGLVFLWVFHVEEILARRSSLVRWGGFLILTGLCVVCVVVFQARSALLGFVFFLLGYALQRGHLAGMVSLTAVIVLALFASGAGTILLERGFSYRLEIWVAVIERLVHECSVLIGCGKDESRILGQFYHPHSGYFSVLYYGGLVSFLILVGLAVSFFSQIWRRHSSWLLVALIGWGGVVTDTNGIIASPRTLWVYFWIPTFMALIESGRPALEAYYSARDAVTRPG